MTDYTILLELAIILLATKSFGLIFRKMGLPQVVGFLIAGLLFGPCVLGWVNPSVTLKVLAEVGVILIMFSAGLETNIKDLKKTGGVALIVASAGVLLPLAGGFLLAAAFNGGFTGLDSEKILKYCFIGIIMTATSVSITVETLRELGKLKTNAGTTILSAAIIDDVIGIALLSVIIGFKDPTVQPIVAIGKIIIYFVLAAGAGYGLRCLFKWLDKEYAHKRRIPIFSLVVCFLFAYIGEKYFGVADITGAYLAGIALSGLKETDYVDKKIETNAYMLFAPVFFASIGINATFSGFDANMLWFCIAFVGVAVVTKFAGCYLSSRALKINRSDSMVIGIGMIARGEVCLIVMQKGITAELLPSNFIAMGVMLVIFSSLIAPILLKLTYNLEDKKFKKQGKDLADAMNGIIPTVNYLPQDNNADNGTEKDNSTTESKN
jgi:Kef-type K+ transport system membrane component KefB